MNQIYIATEGTYSDYHILAVFLDKKKAELFAKCFEYVEIEEFNVFEETTLDKIMECLRLKRDIYFVRVDIAGNTDLILKEDWELSWFELTIRKNPVISAADDLCIYVLAKDEKHAVKIANERRVQLIANNEWKKTVE